MHFGMFPLEHISLDNERFRISLRDPEPDLVKSISKYGSFHPLEVINREPPVLIRGFRFTAAYRAIKVNSIPVIFHDLSDDDAIWHFLFDTIKPGYRDIELALALHKASQGKPDKKYAFIKQYRQLFKEITPDKLDAFGNLPRLYLKRAIRDGLDFKQLCLLLPFSPVNRRFLYSLTHRLYRMTYSQLRQFTDELSDIVNPKCSSLKKFIKDACQSHLKPDKSNSRQNAQSLIHWIHTIRYPIKTELTDHFNALVKSHDWPENLKILTPRDFEGNFLDIMYRLTRETDVQGLIDSLEKQKSALIGLLSILNSSQ